MLFALSAVMASPSAAQYRVSGLVEFTYRNLETKAGNNSVSTQEYWSQNYRVNMTGDLWDPRFLKFNAGVGYTVNSYVDGPDSDIVTYNLFTNFFPGRKVSWDLFGTKSINTIEGSTSIVGYNVTTTSVGGTLNLRLGGNGGNRNNNRNNNLYRGIRWPDISLTHIHTESVTEHPISPLNETRDETRGSLNYRLNSTLDLNIDGGIEKYHDKVKDSSYETKTANIASTLRLSPDVNLKLNGRILDRTTENFVLYNANETNQVYTTLLEFREKQGFRHYYMYEYNDYEYSTSDFLKQRTEANFMYRLQEALQLRGRAEYTKSEYAREPNPSIGDPGEKSSLDTAGLSAGASYRRKNVSSFIGPFNFDAGYDFAFGYSDLSIEGDPASGSGTYYENRVNMGVGPGWEKDTLSLNYSYDSKRDRSPMNNDLSQQSYRLSVSTKRIPRTYIRGSANYTVQDNRSDAGTIFTTAPTFGSQVGVNQQRRSLLYEVTADYEASAYLTFMAGASKGHSASSTYTLSNLQTVVTADDELYYAMANFTYPLSRLLVYRAQFREEYRTNLSAETQSHLVNMYLDYRIRSIFLNLEYRWRKDIPNVGQRTMQQYFFAKLSRPF